MAFKSKYIALSVAALLVGAGSLFAFMPDTPKGVANDPGTSTGQTTVPNSPAVENSTSEQSEKSADFHSENAARTLQPAGKEQSLAGQTPKKLTRQQLLPPPATEDEKLQKAAEQESNF